MFSSFFDDIIERFTRHLELIDARLNRIEETLENLERLQKQLVDKNETMKDLL